MVLQAVQVNLGREHFVVWKPEIEELERRRRLAAEMGGAEGIERQRRRGKLTVRERITALADEGSFREIGGLAGASKYEGEKLASFTPANMVIGTCQIDGRRVVVAGGDFTVRGGASDAAVGDKHGFANRLPLKWRLPYVRLLDATGGSVRTFEQIGRTYIPTNSGTYTVEELLCTAPVVALALGSVAGLPAVEVCLSRFSVMVKGISHLFAGGPPVVKAALGVEISKEELGDERTQVYEGGVVDNLADSEEEAFEMARRFLSYLPPNVWELAPVVATDDPADRREEALIEIVPRERRKAFDMRRLLALVIDRDSLFEIGAGYGRSQITGLARLDGQPVGVWANDGRYYAGAMTARGAHKARRFIELCETFHLPILSFVDEPGFMIGSAAERDATIRHGTGAVLTAAMSSVPWASIIVRRSFGVAQAAHYGPDGYVLAWPSAETGALPVEGGVAVAYHREIAAADDPDARRRELEAQLAARQSPFPRAESFTVHELIDPRDTRPMLCRWIDWIQPLLPPLLGPSAFSARP